jgi:3-phosphoshikimate 1-carboxyvinyltransferase
MADRLIRPGILRGQLTPPPSKSDAHRALICAALAGEPNRVHGLGSHPSEDIMTTRRCLQQLEEAIEAYRTGAKRRLPPLTLDCRESGTTVRLLIPLAAALGVEVTFQGTGRLPQRPLQEYRDIFAGHHVTLEFPGSGSLPLVVRGQLTPGLFQVPGHVSSQYLSGLLLSLPLLPGDSEIVLTTPLESAPYVAMTRHTLGEFGVVTEETPDGFRVAGGQTFLPVDYIVEKDFSQAAFWLVANYFGSEIKLVGLPEHTAQGDRMILPILADLARKRAVNQPFIIDAAQIPDLVPVLAVAASLTPGETRIIHAGRLRLKESDRLAATAEALTAIGAQIRVEDSSLMIRGRRSSPAGQPTLSATTA